MDGGRPFLADRDGFDLGLSGERGEDRLRCIIDIAFGAMAAI